MSMEQALATLRRKSAGLAVAALLTPAMALAGPLGAVAQEEDANVDVLTLRSYPLAIHQGTCETAVAEPAYDLGFLVPRPLFVERDDAFFDEETYETGAYGPFGYGDFYGYGDAGLGADDAIGEDEGLIGDDEGIAEDEGLVGEDEGLGADEGLFDVNEPVAEDTGFLFDDIDDDGIVDYGLDLNADRILDPVEIVERPILWVNERDLADIEANLADDEDAELDDLRTVPHVLMVHRDNVLDTDYLACGEIQGIEDADGELAFAIRPLTANGFVGVAEMQGEEGFLGIGGGGDAEVWVMPSRVSDVTGMPPSET